jgi:ABC-type transporter Mla MlaB component
VGSEDRADRTPATRRGDHGATAPGDRFEQVRSEGSGPTRAIVVTLDEATLPSGLVELRSGVATAIRSRVATLVVDVSRLERLSSSTVTALLWAQRRCRVQGGAVVLRGISAVAGACCGAAASSTCSTWRPAAPGRT